MDQIHDAVRQQFSQHAEYYAQSKVHSEGETLRVLLDFAAPTGPEKVLDIATGTGFTAFAFAPKVTHVTATDLTPAMLDQAEALADERGLQNIDFQVASAEALPFEAASFDLVTCRIAPHHFLGCATIFVGNLSGITSGRTVLHGGFRLSRVGTTHRMAKPRRRNCGIIPTYGGIRPHSGGR